MEHKMYAIKDSAANIYHPPFYKHTHGEAERDFQTLVNDSKSTISMYPHHYDLYFVGTYDTNTGKVQPMDTPQHIVKAADLKQTN